MNPPQDTQRTGSEAEPPVPRPRLEDPAEVTLSTDDLIGDLDPGWLAWRKEQTAR